MVSIWHYCRYFKNHSLSSIFILSTTSSLQQLSLLAKVRGAGIKVQYILTLWIPSSFMAFFAPVTFYSLWPWVLLQYIIPALLWKQHNRRRWHSKMSIVAVKHSYNAINYEKAKIASWISLVLYFTKIGKRWNQYVQHFCKCPQVISVLGKILYAIHTELFAFLSALPAASPICSEPAGCVQGTHFCRTVVMWMLVSTDSNMASPVLESRI